jgi:hypothetical protein
MSVMAAAGAGPVGISLGGAPPGGVVCAPTRSIAVKPQSGINL